MKYTPTIEKKNAIFRTKFDGDENFKITNTVIII